MFNRRQLEILLELCENPDRYMTASYFAQKQQVSLRTIQGDIKAIKSSLAEYPCVEFQSAPPKGSRIVVKVQPEFTDFKENLYQQFGNTPLNYQSERINMGIIEGTYGAKCGHPGGSLSSTDVFTYLYFKEMNIDPKNPKDPNRDRFVLSKGHCAPGLYAALAHRGFFPVEDLPTLRHIGSYLQGHPNMNETPGVDMSTGSLGQGISAAAGMALAAKYQKKDCRVYALLGDGELAEGQVWEACMLAAHYNLDNLCIIIDKNGLQIDGKVTDVMDSNPVPEKLWAFGFKVAEVNGHDLDELENAFSQARATKGAPFAIVMDTTKGKGVSFMENQAGWHGKAPNDQEYEQAMTELKAQLAELEAE